MVENVREGDRIFVEKLRGLRDIGELDVGATSHLFSLNQSWRKGKEERKRREKEGKGGG